MGDREDWEVEKASYIARVAELEELLTSYIARMGESELFARVAKMEQELTATLVVANKMRDEREAILAKAAKMTAMVTQLEADVDLFRGRWLLAEKTVAARENAELEKLRTMREAALKALGGIDEDSCPDSYG
jgi:hypothetical protein